MVKFLELVKASDGVHKYVARFETEEGREKNVPFGAAGMNDYTRFSPMEREKRKERYMMRHRKREDWNDPTSPGALSRWILWNKPSVKASLADYKRRFNF